VRPEATIAADTRLLGILRWMRPHDSDVEKMFVQRTLGKLPGVVVDTFGNHRVVVGDAAPVALWSCHTDTVHHVAGIQNIGIDKSGLVWTKDGSCLGADDGAGVYLLLRMIEAKVPGLYVFHRGEERGCLGSKWLLEHDKARLDGIKFAVAFDRKGTTDIITHQSGTRTCSDAFGKSLAVALGMEHKCSANGLFTDTNVYRKVIPECSNVACGYENAHGSQEELDTDYVMQLALKLCALDVTKLVCERDPAVVEDSWSAWTSREGYGRYYGGMSNRTYNRSDPNYYAWGSEAPPHWMGYKGLVVRGWQWEDDKWTSTRVEPKTSKTLAKTWVAGGYGTFRDLRQAGYAGKPQDVKKFNVVKLPPGKSCWIEGHFTDESPIGCTVFGGVWSVIYNTRTPGGQVYMAAADDKRWVRKVEPVKALPKPIVSKLFADSIAGYYTDLDDDCVSEMETQRAGAEALASLNTWQALVTMCRNYPDAVTELLCETCGANTETLQYLDSLKPEQIAEILWGRKIRARDLLDYI